MTDISIIVPIYNSEKYIKKCIDSLINQTKEELEFILINDGSTDKTEEIIKEIKDKRIKYYKNENQGIGKTRNFGIEKATGNYIMFLDSDDYLELNACEELYKKIIKDKSDIVISDFYKIYSNEKKEHIKLLHFLPTKLKNKPDLLININLGPCNKLYKNELIKENKIKFVENLKYEDAPFVAECLDKANRISKLNMELSAYVIHENSETTIRDKNVFDILKIVEKIRKYFENKKYMDEVIKKLIVKILTNYTIQQRVQVDKKISIKFINESFEYIKKYVPDYKKNKYYENRGLLRKTIEKNKLLTIIYCRAYQIKRKMIKNE